MEDNMKDFPNDEQLRVIEHLHGPLLVLAPAGTGKTRVMAARLMHALERGGVTPDRTLCVTFTNRAADEMRRSIKSTLGDRMREAHVFTFHGLCAWILRQEACDLGFPPDFVIYDDNDSQDVLMEVCREMDACKQVPNLKDFFWGLSQWKSNVAPEDLRFAGPPPLFRGERSVRKRVAEEYHCFLEDLTPSTSPT
jgi:DNA helicase-2/ATP-dependent DNA helicase PcrA